MTVPTDRVTPQYTPDLGGYLAAVAISRVFITVGMGLVMAADPHATWGMRLEYFGLGVVLFGGLAALFGVPAGTAGVLVVHFLCRRRRQQWVHVVVTGLIGVVAVCGVTVVMSEGLRDWLRVAVGVGVCVAASRALLIPWVPIVRDAYPHGTPAWRRWRLR
jgi:hypothetical protein